MLLLETVQKWFVRHLLPLSFSFSLTHHLLPSLLLGYLSNSFGVFFFFINVHSCLINMNGLLWLSLCVSPPTLF